MNRLEGERATSQEPQLAYLLCVAIVRGVVRTGVRSCNWRCCTLLGACAGERLLPRTTNTRPAHHARPTLTCCPSSIEGALLDSTAAVWMPHMHTGVCTRCCCHVMRLHVVRCGVRSGCVYPCCAVHRRRCRSTATRAVVGTISGRKAEAGADTLTAGNQSQRSLERAQVASN